VCVCVDEQQFHRFSSHTVYIYKILKNDISYLRHHTVHSRESFISCLKGQHSSHLCRSSWMKNAIDHKSRVSYFGQQVGYDLEDLRYLVLSKRRIIPAYTTMEKRDGPRRPERKMLHPSREVFDIYMTDRTSVWYVEITYGVHNITRKRPGGRDETWPEEKFLDEIQSCIQYPFKNRFLLFKVKGGVDENDKTIALDVRQKKGDTVMNYMQACVLDIVPPEQAHVVISEAVTLENTIASFYAGRGNLKRLKMYTENGCDLSSVGDGHWTLLQLAAYHGYMEIVTYLITEKQADLNIRSRDGLDALFCAIKGGHFEIFQTLVEAGAEVRSEADMQPGEDGHMTYAVACNRVDIVRYLNRPDGPFVRECIASHGVRNTDPPGRLFTTIDGGYPFSHAVEAAKKTRPSKSRGGPGAKKKTGAPAANKK
jgi:hypothetical protein